MNFKKVISVLLVCIFLFTQITTVFADTEVTGASLRLSSVLHMYNLKLYDTYYIGDEVYECNIDKEKNIRLYYNKSKDILVTDTEILKKLEVVYFVTNQNNGFLGFFTESNLKVHISELKTELESKTKKLQDKYANLDFWKGLAYTTSTLGQNLKNGTDVLIKRDNLYKGTAKNILLQYLQSTQDKAIRNEKLKQYVTELIQSSIFATFEDCIWNLKEAESIYSTVSINDLKHYEKAIQIFNKYEFSSVTFTYAWNYAEKEMIPKITKDAEGLNTIGWMMNYALVGVVGLDPALITASSNDASYPKHEELINYIKNNNIDENDLSDIFGFAVNTYNNKLTLEEIKVIDLL